MQFQYNDGGRAAAGYKGKTGDCVVRAVAIATELSYQQVYDALSEGCKNERKSKKSSARNGVHVRRKWFKDYMAKLNWTWVPTMGIGTGCKVHLTDGELPGGRLIVTVSKHWTAVIDGVIHDTHNPQREVHITELGNNRELKPGETRNQNGISRISRRCVYGYYHKLP